MKKRTPVVTVDASSVQHDGDVASFQYEDEFGRKEQGFVVHWRGELYAYRNRCPHWSTPLDEHGDGVFDAGELVCRTHGARFEPDTGSCVSGPCRGDKLQPLRVESGDRGRIEIYRSGLRF